MNMIHSEDEFGELNWKTAFFPFLFVLLIVLIKYIEVKTGNSFAHYGLYPGRPSSVYGLITSPLLHADIPHLFNNSWSFLVLGTALYYFYKKLFWRVFLISFIGHGIMLYFIGRPSYHIGASGLVYAFAAFLFVSGLIRRHPRLMATSLMVVFLYGSLVWGVFPIVEHMSWEAHLSGSIIGILLAILYRKKGVQKKVYHWEEEDEDDYYLTVPVFGVEEIKADPIHPDSEEKDSSKIHIQYHFKKKEP